MLDNVGAYAKSEFRIGQRPIDDLLGNRFLLRLNETRFNRVDLFEGLPKPSSQDEMPNITVPIVGDLRRQGHGPPEFLIGFANFIPPTSLAQGSRQEFVTRRQLGPFLEAPLEVNSFWKIITRVPQQLAGLFDNPRQSAEKH